MCIHEDGLINKFKKKNMVTTGKFKHAGVALAACHPYFCESKPFVALSPCLVKDVSHILSCKMQEIASSLK